MPSGVTGSPPFNPVKIVCIYCSERTEASFPAIVAIVQSSVAVGDGVSGVKPDDSTWKLLRGVKSGSDPSAVVARISCSTF